MTGYNINMVSLQEQFELACALARANGATRTAVVCTLAQLRTLKVELKEGEGWDGYVARFPNGAHVRWVNSVETDLNVFGGFQLTTLFIAEGARGDVVRALQARLRSSQFKGDFKIYYPHGHVMWEKWEQYGG